MQFPHGARNNCTASVHELNRYKGRQQYSKWAETANGYDTVPSVKHQDTGQEHMLIAIKSSGIPRDPQVLCAGSPSMYLEFQALNLHLRPSISTYAGICKQLILLLQGIEQALSTLSRQQTLGRLHSHALQPGDDIAAATGLPPDYPDRGEDLTKQQLGTSQQHVQLQHQVLHGDQQQPTLLEEADRQQMNTASAGWYHLLS